MRRVTANADVNQSWHVTAVPDVAKTIAHYGLDCADFVPTLRIIINKLKENPFEFPIKEGILKEVRGARLHFQRQKYRLLYIIQKKERRVRVIALEERASSRVYKTAQRRIKSAPSNDQEIPDHE